MNFKQIVDSENRRLRNEVTQDEKNRLLANGKTYIFFQELMTEIQSLLDKDETVQGYLPLSTSGNLAISNQGIAGLSYARTERAKQYVAQFNDTRSNRLFVFSEKRILFLVIIDFLDDQTYFSYPYSSIPAFSLKTRKLNRFEKPEDEQIMFWAYFDFQSDSHIFSDVLTKKDYQLFQHFHDTIPALKKIPITEKIHRKNPLDYIISNWHFNYRLMIFVNLLLILLAIGLVLGIVFGIGIFKDWYYRDLIGFVDQRSFFVR
ncbi:hypothetical protein [Enterococcus gallinarum]|uniref:hypothetical protein n=1 Tax=Enterococcus gallinarum TaxID=1353 RepID=UPI0039A57839